MIRYASPVVSTRHTSNKSFPNELFQILELLHGDLLKVSQISYIFYILGLLKVCYEIKLANLKTKCVTVRFLTTYIYELGRTSLKTSLKLEHDCQNPRQLLHIPNRAVQYGGYVFSCVSSSITCLVTHRLTELGTHGLTLS